MFYTESDTRKITRYIATWHGFFTWILQNEYIMRDIEICVIFRKRDIWYTCRWKLDLWNTAEIPATTYYCQRNQLWRIAALAVVLWTTCQKVLKPLWYRMLRIWRVCREVGKLEWRLFSYSAGFGYTYFLFHVIYPLLAKLKGNRSFWEYLPVFNWNKLLWGDA